MSGISVPFFCVRRLWGLIRAYLLESEKNMGLIREGASSRLFHFLNGCHLLRMLRRGSMRTCAPESYYYSGGRRFIDGAGVRYMSFTRNKNAGEGYPLLKYGGVGDGDDQFICRVEVDGDYLSSHNLRRSDGRSRGGYEDVRVVIDAVRKDM